MLGRPRTKPYALLCHEALYRRLKTHHRANPALRQEMYRYEAGYRGEKDVDYTLSTILLTNTSIYRDIRLRNSSSFQIDTLVVTPAFALIIEIKNMTDELSYDAQHDQFIQTIGTDRKRQPNPIHQSYAQKQQFTAWLNNMNMPAIPIETLSVISNPNAILSNIEASDHVARQLIHMETLPAKLHSLQQTCTTPVLDQTARHQLDTLIHQHHTPYKPDLIHQYGLSEQDLIKGLACEICDHHPLQRRIANWYCPNCGATNKYAHLQAIYDYFLLYRSSLTNQQARRYLRLSSRHVTYDLLKGMNLTTTGMGKSTKYHAPSLEQFPQNSRYQDGRKFHRFQKGRQRSAR